MKEKQMPQMGPVTPARPEVSALLSELDAYTPAKADAVAKRLLEEAQATRWHGAERIAVIAVLFAICVGFMAVLVDLSASQATASALVTLVFLALSAAPSVREGYRARVARGQARAYDPVSTVELERLTGLVEPHPQLRRVVATWRERGIAIRKHEADLLEEAATVLKEDRIRRQFASLGQASEVAHD